VSAGEQLEQRAAGGECSQQNLVMSRRAHQLLEGLRADLRLVRAICVVLHDALVDAHDEDARVVFNMVSLLNQQISRIDTLCLVQLPRRPGATQGTDCGGQAWCTGTASPEATHAAALELGEQP
jgi:hypothetical protein